MDEFSSTAVQTGLLLSVQSSVVQAGHTALEAQLCHPIVDQQEVSQLREKGPRLHHPRLPGCAARLPLRGLLRITRLQTEPLNPRAT